MFSTFVIVKRFLKYLSFSTVGEILLMLVFATILEKQHGTPFVSEHIYRSPWMIALWTVLAISGALFTLLSKIYKHIASCMLHISFLVILAGALTTYLFGKQGLLHLRTEAPPTTIYMISDGSIGRFPFQISLNEFRLECYPGTFAPMDYVSKITIIENGKDFEGVISMNNIFKYKGYRLYQSGYDDDMQGTTLYVSHDPYGIAITYTGYVMLLLSMLAYFFDKNCRFRKLLQSPLLKRGTTVVLFLFASIGLANSANTLSHDFTKEFGNLYIYYNNRVCPLQTFAKDFTIKLYGKATYNGATAEEVLAGWCFYPETWSKEPMIKIKDREIATILGIEGKYASYNDFTLPNGKYKLENTLRNSNNNALRRAALKAHEKYNLIEMVCNGTILKLYPHYKGDNETPVWYSMSEKKPENFEAEQWPFMEHHLGNVAKLIKTQNYDKSIEELYIIRDLQRFTAGSSCPSDARFEAEKIYNTHNYIRILAMLCATIGIFTFIYYCRIIAFVVNIQNPLHKPLTALLILILAYLSIFMVLRGYIGGHLPLSNGFETMVFMAWCVTLLTLIVNSKFTMAVPFGFLLCGLALMVAMIGESNPQITQLIPVLQSPLLSLHVVVIMISYSLFAFAMLNGVTALTLWYIKKDYRQVEHLAVISKIILYPAVFLITAGIFIGAVWANVSWGRYWGWDPKEVWALITMLVYSLALHDKSLSIFRRPLTFHVFCIVAFITVLMTYFGVNFILGGIHSYA
ncbi:MAG: cytochrome c biogenesis protein CcsA [Bacteroidaceae bacterium]|nr:cytochrome c biogenesis protein CcsA [Bacteroidaceae bacterium]